MVAGLVLLYRHHPAEIPLLPRCTWYQLTHLYCPGCGGTRALHYLLNGEVAAAMRMNAMFPLLLPALVWWFVRWFRFSVLRQTPAPVPGARWLSWSLASVVILYAVLRNLPGLECLAPH